MHKKAWQALAIVCLIVAIAAGWYAVDGTLAAGRMQGPSGLVVTPQGEVWIGVDHALWRADRDGQLLGEEPFATVGLAGRPANLVRHPDGRIVAQVRDDPTLYFIDPVTRRVVRRLAPRWPADLARHGARAINLAFHADGRFAVATGGGHTVALFDAEGGFLARSAPDTYNFSNGLWWVGDALWTTDTNRFELKRLDGRTLAVEQAVRLPDGPGSFLGPARAHPAGGPPMAAMVRFRPGMIVGRVVLLGPDGRETASLEADDMEPMDLDWLGGELLVTDARALSVRRWSADGSARPAFGDAELRSRLAAVADARAVLERRYAKGLLVAVPVFALGLLFAALAERMKRQALQADRPIDLSRLGTPRLGWWREGALLVRLMGWPLLALLPLWAAVELPGWIDASKGLRLAVLAAAVVLAAATLPFAMARQRRLCRQPEFEPLVNGQPMRLLTRSQALAPLLARDEPVLETLLLMRARQRWLVLTDRRLLVFEGNLLDQSFAAEYPLSQVAAASTERGAVGGDAASVGSWWWRWLFTGWLEIRLRDGSLLAGAVQAPTVAARVVERLRAAGAAAIAPSLAPPPEVVPGPGATRAALASALLPGLGQWWQRRSATALLMFLPWAVLMLAEGIPLLWALAGPRRQVEPNTILMIASLHLLIAALSAYDAWRLAPRRLG